MLVWPLVAVVGFVVLAVLVIALASSSTARYEFERNQVQGQRQQLAVPAGAGESPVSGSVLSQPGGEVTQGQRAAVSVATHPAGKRVVDPGATPGWWLVDEWRGRAGGQGGAGPLLPRREGGGAARS